MGRHTLPLRAITERITTISQNKQQSQLSENQAVWKSDNQGFKEATFIQTGRRAESQNWAEKCRDAVWHGKAVAVEWEVPHMWWIKIRRKQLEPQTRSPSPGFQCQEDKLPQLLAIKTSGSWGSGRNCWIFRRVHLKGLHRLWMYIKLPTLGFTTRAIAGRVPVIYRKWVKWLEMGQVLGKPPETRQWNCPLSGPFPPHRATEPSSGLPHLGGYLGLCPTQFTGTFSTTVHSTKTGSQSSST